MKTVMVTGSGGYIGSHVVEELARESGVQVLAFDSREKTSSNPQVTCIAADLLSDEFDLSTYCDEVPDVCLHLAWRNGFAHNDSSHMLDLSGHYRFLEHLMDAGVRQIACMGTMHEVGYWEGAIDEHTPCNPQSLYGVAKNALRQSFLLLAKQRGVNAQWLRAFYIYGDDAASQSIFGKLLRASQDGATVFPFTSGKNKFDFIEVRTLARQIARCVLQDDVLGIINCCSGEPVSLGERVEGFIREHGLDIALDYGAYPDRPYDSPAVWGDSGKIDRIIAASAGSR